MMSDDMIEEVTSPSTRNEKNEEVSNTYTRKDNDELLNKVKDKANRPKSSRRRKKVKVGRDACQQLPFLLLVCITKSSFS